MIHRDGCPFMPGREERFFLGVYGNADDPANESRLSGMKPRKCRFCCPGDHNVEFSDAMPLIRKVPEEQWDSVFVSSVN